MDLSYDSTELKLTCSLTSYFGCHVKTWTGEVTLEDNASSVIRDLSLFSCGVMTALVMFGSFKVYKKFKQVPTVLNWLSIKGIVW